MSDDAKKSYEEKAQRLPKVTNEQLSNIKALCEGLVLPTLSDCKPLGEKAAVEFCEKVDVELVKRNLPKIQKPSEPWQCKS